ncbi:mitochondrial thiamine pyrophosphate carrier-like [Bombyx mandarina]|uniref:Mitochondrial carrier protein n=2 Tax=Bombyx TaxID=7090 RepID=A0A8R1WP35_BOMMO|nr:mitochondrial thiamine pyrophosphate carrier [Bombyx mori]XP_028034217.1 mitochondrial thiamine pyrophosphate carrier-like [Bombyx mandarina]
MVGYQENDTLTSNQKLISGCVSGFMTRFITQPLDVVKLREQLKSPAVRAADQKEWFKATRKIFKNEGITAFWQGHNVGQIHSMISLTCQFFVYEVSTKAVAVSNVHNRYKPFLVFMCGVLAGGSTALLVSPLEVIRVRQMLNKSQYKGIINGAREVYKTRGILSFYEGVNASLLQMGPSVGIGFAVFNFVQPLVLARMHNCDRGHCKSGRHHYNPEHVLLASTIAGSASGFVSKSVTYPFDLAKRRMQISSYRSVNQPVSKELMKCTSLSDCLVNMYREDGIRGMFRGWKITIYKAQITSIVSFTSYELMCYSLRQI